MKIKLMDEMCDRIAVSIHCRYHFQLNSCVHGQRCIVRVDYSEFFFMSLFRMYGNRANERHSIFMKFKLGNCN